MENETYQRMYTYLFNAVTDALEELEKLNIYNVKEILTQGQIQAERIYLEANYDDTLCTGTDC